MNILITSHLTSQLCRGGTEIHQECACTKPRNFSPNSQRHACMTVYCPTSARTVPPTANAKYLYSYCPRRLDGQLDPCRHLPASLDCLSVFLPPACGLLSWCPKKTRTVLLFFLDFSHSQLDHHPRAAQYSALNSPSPASVNIKQPAPSDEAVFHIRSAH